MKQITKRIIFGILILINCVAIFYFSNQVSSNSNKQSNKIVEIISNLIPAVKNMSAKEKAVLKKEVLIPIVRKSAHFSIYLLLGILLTNFMLTMKNQKYYQIVILALLIAFFYANTDEFHQTFIEGRTGQLIDVFIDSAGALSGILITIVINKIRTKNKKGKHLKNDEN